MSKEIKHAMWLENLEGDRGLYHADDVDAALMNGYRKIEGERANGELWNPEFVEGESYHLDLIAEGAKAQKEIQAKKDEKKLKAQDEQRKANEKAAQAAPEKADMTVKVVK